MDKQYIEAQKSVNNAIEGNACGPLGGYDAVQVDMHIELNNSIDKIIEIRGALIRLSLKVSGEDASPEESRSNTDLSLRQFLLEKPDQVDEIVEDILNIINQLEYMLFSR